MHLMKRAFSKKLGSEASFALALRLLPPEGRSAFRSSQDLILALGYVLPGPE